MELIGVTYSGIALSKNSIVYFDDNKAPKPLTPNILTYNLIGITLEGLTGPSAGTYIAIGGRIVSDTRNFEVLDSLYVGTGSQLTNTDPGVTYSIRVGTVLKKSIIGEFEFTPKYVFNIQTPRFKSSQVFGASFSGNPKKFTYVFETPYTNLDYVINITGSASRVWSYEVKGTASFRINSNSNLAFTGEVSVVTSSEGEN